MATINIGTDKGNIINAEIGKKFEDIKYSDVLEVAKKSFLKDVDFKIHGWCESK